MADGGATVSINDPTPASDNNYTPPPGAACPHLRPMYIGEGKYKAVGFWVMGGVTGKLSYCGLECGQAVTRGNNMAAEVTDESLRHYCIDGDPEKPSDVLLGFWRRRGMLHD